MTKKQPRYVKRANMWAVTVFTMGDKKMTQKVEFFSSEKEAWNFYTK
jgi:hypothetical protein